MCEKMQLSVILKSIVTILSLISSKIIGLTKIIKNTFTQNSYCSKSVPIFQVIQTFLDQPVPNKLSLLGIFKFILTSADI